jgi:hypothetical protein
MRKIVFIQFFVLLGGTLFAWFNFSQELISWLNKKSCTLGCAGADSINPFLSVCFYGALFFTTALILNIIVIKKK